MNPKPLSQTHPKRSTLDAKPEALTPKPLTRNCEPNPSTRIQVAAEVGAGLEGTLMWFLNP
eukprot:CAMPEP_0180255756 /NCGR_PEP_ID=MMETSP0987-20121128/40903_1 /TAXON_ID=697907 /ORGANISM="non described non described, Strain CCMP2293" /LENGTH=60 /DNA_ID=CAMNT_0022224911 /DNA_START=60 /DNA_END=243 /DNA_ORIENTATION=-